MSFRQIYKFVGSGVESWGQKLDNMFAHMVAEQYKTRVLPVFRAHKDGQTQGSLATATWYPVTFIAEDIDTNSDFTSSVFFPTEEGYYSLTAQARVAAASAAGTVHVAIRKNDVIKAEAENAVLASGTVTVSVSDDFFANGTTDTFDMVFQHDTGGTESISGASKYTFFKGHRI